ncbi:MAG: DUF3253 domain-containing protein [Polyangiaceae bacterium]
MGRGSAGAAARFRLWTAHGTAAVPSKLAHYPKTACRSDVARSLAPDNWRSLMTLVRAPAARLAKRSRIDMSARKDQGRQLLPGSASTWVGCWVMCNHSEAFLALQPTRRLPNHTLPAEPPEISLSPSG